MCEFSAPPGVASLTFHGTRLPKRLRARGPGPPGNVEEDKVQLRILWVKLGAVSSANSGQETLAELPSGGGAVGG